MNSTNGALNFDAYIRDTDFNQTIQNMERRLIGLSGSAVKESQKMDSAFDSLARRAAGFFAFTELAQLPGKIVQVRGEFQKLEIALGTMLKNKAAADKLLGEIVQTAGTTPFGLMDLSAGTKQLLAYGSEAKNVISEIRMLGDVASGTSNPINDLIYLYGTLRSQGRAYSVDIRQFAGRGVPIYAELAKVLNVSVGEVNALVEAGKVGFPQVEQAFRNMTSAGGMFGGLMEAQSKSLPGLIERFSDAIDVMMNDIGRANEGLAASVITGATGIVENYQEVIDVLKVIVATYGAYKAAVLTVAGMKAAEATTTLAVSMAVDKQSGSYAREIALKVKSAQASSNRAAAVAADAWAEQANAAAKVQSLRTEVASAAAKKASTIEAARLAAAEITAAEARLAAATANQAATASYLSASVRTAAAKEVEAAQNALLAASENGVIARKAASAASSDFLAKKTALEVAAKEANVLAERTNATAAAASIAAKNASSAASVKLTSVQALQIAVTRQLAAAQAAFNATLLSNPIVLAATTITALAGAVWYLSDGTTAAELAQRSFNKIQEDDQKIKDDLSAKTSKFTSVIQSDTETKYAQIQAYQSLQKLYPKVLGSMSLHEFQALKTADAQRMLNAAMDEAGIGRASKSFEDATKKVEELEKRMQSLIDQQKLSSGGSGAMVLPIERTRKELEAAKLEAEKLGEVVKENTQAAWEAHTPVEEQIKHYQDLQTSLKKQRSEVETNIQGLNKAGKAANELQLFFANMSLLGLNQQLDQAGAKLLALQGKPNVLFGGNKAHWEKIRTTAEEDRNALGVAQRGSKEWNRLTEEIQKADKQLEKYSTREKKVAEKDKPQPFGSIAYWEQVARKADEAMQKLPGTKKGEIERQNQIKIDAEREADKIRKSLSKVEVKTLNDELEEKRKLYELYYRWVTAYGEESANKQFESLISKNKSYLDYLNAQISRLEGMRTGAGLTNSEADSLANLIGQRNELTGVDTPMQKFAKDMDLARSSSESLTEEILKLKEIQSGFDLNDMSLDGISKRQQLQERINEATKQRTAQLKEFLVSVVGSEQKRLEIETHYKNLREALEVQYANNKGEAYKKALDAINNAEKAETVAFEVEKVKQSKGYQELERIIELSTNEQTKIRLDAEKKKLSALESTNQKYKNSNKELTDDYIAQLLRVRQAEEAHKQKSIQMWGQIAGVVGQLGDVLQDMGGSIGEVGGALSGLSGQFGNMSTFANSIGEDGKVSAEGWAAAIQGVITMIGTLVQANKRRKEAEKRFAIEAIGYENEYALALNRKIGADYNQNPFYQDYEGQIKAAVDQYKDAYKKYQDAVDKVVEEGRVKERQKDVVDGKSLGTMVGSGAVAGAAIGTAIGGWAFGIGTVVGTAIGAVVGLIGGLFAKKKKDVYGAIKEQYEAITDEMGNLNVEMAKALIANNQADEKTKQMLENAIALHEEMQKAREEINSTMKDLTGEIGDNLRNALVNAFKEGKDAAEALRETVGSIIADVASKLIFSKLMGPVIDKLTEEMTYSLTEGDGAIIDDLDRFGNKVNGYALANVKAVEESQKMLDEWLKTNGYDTIGGSSKKQNSLPGAIQGMSQETASLIAGQFNAMRISIAESYKIQIDSNQIMRTQLFHLSGIENNTANIDRNTSKLESLLGAMLKKMGGSIDESLRGRGGVGI